MKKLILVLSSFILLLSCAKPPKAKSYRGTIIMCGNEPFVFPVMKTDDGKEFGFETDSETKNKLLKAMSKVEVTGVLIKDEPDVLSLEGGKDGTLELESWKVIE